MTSGFGALVTATPPHTAVKYHAQPTFYTAEAVDDLNG